MSERLFPIMVTGYRHDEQVARVRDGGGCLMVVALPWAMLAPHEARAQKNHSQSLERLAERGGLSACEALWVLRNQTLAWKGISDDIAHRDLALLLAEFLASRAPDHLECGDLSGVPAQSAGARRDDRP